MGSLLRYYTGPGPVPSGLRIDKTSILYTLFLLEQFYKDNGVQISPKIRNKLRTIEARFRRKCKCNIF